VIEVAVVVQYGRAGLDGGRGERDIDNTGRPSRARVPQRRADIEDDLVDVRRHGQVEERGS